MAALSAAMVVLNEILPSHYQDQKEGLLFPLEKPLRIFFISFKGHSRLNECLSVRVHGVVGVCVYVWRIYGMNKLAS